MEQLEQLARQIRVRSLVHAEEWPNLAHPGGLQRLQEALKGIRKGIASLNGMLSQELARLREQNLSECERLEAEAAVRAVTELGCLPDFELALSHAVSVLKRLGNG